VERAPGDSKALTYPGRAEAAAGVQALRMAHDLLVAPVKPKHPGGRKSKLDDETQEIIFNAIRDGLTQKDAATLAGVHEDTFGNWARKGQQAKSGKYHRFFRGLTHAYTEGKAELVRGIRSAGKQDWRAQAWLLERRHPSEYGKQVFLQGGIELQVGAQRETMRGLMAPALPPGNGHAIEATAEVVPQGGNGSAR